MWTNRNKVVSGRQSILAAVDGQKPRATWAAVGLAICSLGVQVTNFVRTDLRPLIDLSRANSAMLKRIEQTLQQHNQRLERLEKMAESNQQRIAALEGTQKR